MDASLITHKRRMRFFYSKGGENGNPNRQAWIEASREKGESCSYPEFTSVHV
jgi:hypothetical protein